VKSSIDKHVKYLNYVNRFVGSEVLLVSATLRILISALLVIMETEIGDCTCLLRP